MSLFYTIFWGLRDLKTEKRIKNIPKKVITKKDELSIFEKKMTKYMKTLKFTNSIPQMVKIFSNIKEEIGKILESNKSIDLIFDGEIINSMEDTQKIDMVQNKYIKDFLNNKINLELAKEKEVSSIFLKESLIKKALNISLKVLEYIPEDVEMRLRILELEEKLLKCYENKGGKE